MVQDMRDNINIVKNRVRGNSIGQITHRMKGNFMRIIYMGMASINGVMVEYIGDHGKIIKWMVKVYLHGMMAENILELI